MKEIWEFIMAGMSGWITSILTLLLCGVGTYYFIKRRSRQSNIKAGGDVAGGDIVKGQKTPKNGERSSKKVVDTVQSNISAQGDVAGGDIIKGGE